MAKQKYITISEYAKYLGVTRQTVWHRIKRGEISAQKIGNQYVIDVSVLTTEITEKAKRQIEAGVEKVTEEYKELLEWLSKE